MQVVRHTSFPKTTAVVKGVQVQLDVPASTCQHAPCVHADVSIWLLREGGNHNAKLADISTGAEIQCVYMILGEPGWVDGAACKHFEKYKPTVTHELIKSVYKKLRTFVKTWLATPLVVAPRPVLTLVFAAPITTTQRRRRAIAKPKQRKKAAPSKGGGDDDGHDASLFAPRPSGSFNINTPTERDLSSLPPHLRAGYRALYARLDQRGY